MSQLSTPLKPVYVTTVTSSALGAAYGFLGIEPSALPELFIRLASLVSVVLWVEDDARLRQFSSIQDWGMFVFLFWPLLVPWYVFKTRGTRAWTLALVLLGAAVAPGVENGMAALWRDMARHVLHT